MDTMKFTFTLLLLLHPFVDLNNETTNKRGYYYVIAQTFDTTIMMMKKNQSSQQQKKLSLDPRRVHRAERLQETHRILEQKYGIRINPDYDRRRKTINLTLPPIPLLLQESHYRNNVGSLVDTPRDSITTTTTTTTMNNNNNNNNNNVNYAAVPIQIINDNTGFWHRYLVEYEEGSMVNPTPTTTTTTTVHPTSQENLPPVATTPTTKKPTTTFVPIVTPTKPAPITAPVTEAKTGVPVVRRPTTNPPSPLLNPPTTTQSPTDPLSPTITPIVPPTTAKPIIVPPPTTSPITITRTPPTKQPVTATPNSSRPTTTLPTIAPVQVVFPPPTSVAPMSTRSPSSIAPVNDIVPSPTMTQTPVVVVQLPPTTTSVPIVLLPPTTLAPIVSPTTSAPIVPPTTPVPIIIPPMSPAPIVIPTTPAPVVPPTTEAPIVPPTTEAPIVPPTTETPIVFPKTIAPVVIPTSPAPIVLPTTPPPPEVPVVVVAAPVLPIPVDAPLSVPVPEPVVVPIVSPVSTTTPVATVLNVRDVILSVALMGGEEFMDSTSYQSRALLWLEQSVVTPTLSSERIIQRYALASIYEATNNVRTVFTDEALGDGNIVPWIRRRDWLSDNNECNWVNIECNEFNQIIVLDLFGNLVSGEFPPEIVLFKTTLQIFDVGDNFVFTRGTIFNPYLGQLTELIDLRYENTNFINNNGVPSEISNLKKLEHYNCANVRYVGALNGDAFPKDLIKLTHLEIEFNSYNSILPSAISELPNLLYLYIRNSFLQGDISFLQNMKTIEECWIDSNEGLSGGGTLPTFLGSVSTLVSFSAAEVGYVGPLPTEIGQLSKLQQLFLYDNAFTGSIPNQWENLKQLQRFEIQLNTMTGEIPSEICTLTVGDSILQVLKADCNNCPLDLGFNCCTSCFNDEGIQVEV